MLPINFELPKKKLEPYPHLFCQNFLDDGLRLSLRECFKYEVFTIAEGGCPVSNIQKDSCGYLLDFKDQFLFKSLIPCLDEIFTSEIAAKKKELESVNRDVRRLEKPSFGFLHLTKNSPRTKINSHRDDDRATYQFVIYLGDIHDQEIETTELIYVKDIDDLESNGDYTNLRLLSYGATNNGFLCFANVPEAYHCLSKEITFERMTIAGSVIHYVCD
jgi:hypothetical protein